jgi:hypothetical protein
LVAVSQTGGTPVPGATPTFNEREPYENGFGAIFKKEIAPQLAGLEAERLRLKKERTTRIILAVVLGVVILAATLIFASKNSTILTIGIFLAILIPVFVVGSAADKFRDKLRGVVMGPASRFLGVTYSRKVPDTFGIKRFVKRSVVGSYSSATIQDHVAGEHKGRRYEMAEAHLRRRQGKNTVTIFHGILLSIDWPESAQADVLIGRDYGKLINKIAGLGKAQRVNFDDAEFERRYECYASDPMIAQRIVTPTFMQSMVAIGDGRKGERPTACFTEGKFLLAVPLAGVNLFEPGSLSRSVDTFETDMHTLLRQLTLPRRVIETLQGSRQAIL